MVYNESIRRYFLSFFEHLRHWLEFFPAFSTMQRKEPLHFGLEEPYDEMLHLLAQAEQRSPQEVATGLLRDALVERRKAELNLERWRALSPREQEAAALICLNYTNRQIAARMGISPETVKTHVHNLLRKFNVKKRSDLRQALADWDFSAWAE
jgi:DNA-binding CsgD family transcriptional regulator